MKKCCLGWKARFPHYPARNGKPFSFWLDYMYVSAGAAKPRTPPKMESSAESLDDQQLMKVHDAIVECGNNLQIATSCLLSCFVEDDSSVDAFVALRGKVLNEACVYREKVLPLSKVVVENMRDFFSNYADLTFEDWQEDLQGIAKEAHQYAEEAKFLALIHERLLTNFKQMDGEVTRVLQTLHLEAQRYKNQMEQLQREAESKYRWAIGLMFLPVIGLIPSAILSAQGDIEMCRAIAKKEEVSLAVRAANLVDGPLKEALSNFVGLMCKVSGSQFGKWSTKTDGEPDCRILLGA